MTGDVQLVEIEVENDTIVGIVQVCYNDTWGLVCNNGWNDTDTQVVCTNMFGYYSAGWF